MQRRGTSGRHVLLLTGAGAVFAVAFGLRTLSGQEPLRELVPYADSSGLIQTISTIQGADDSNPFFQPLGTNGRTCASRHVARDGDGAQESARDPAYERSRAEIVLRRHGAVR